MNLASKLPLSFQRKMDSILGAMLIGLFRIPSLILGKILRRDHSLEVKNKIVVIKVRGGGSLLIAGPSLLAIRTAHPNKEFILICSPDVVPFAQILPFEFSQVQVVQPNSFAALLKTSFAAIIAAWRADCFIDFEIHSKLTKVFALLTCARNRLGFYMAWNSWQHGFTTHKFFYNDSSPIYLSYNQVAIALGGVIPEMSAFVKMAREKISRISVDMPQSRFQKKYGLAPFSSSLCPEREFSPEDWAQLLRREKVSEGTIFLFGGKADLPREEDFLRRFRASYGDAVELVSLVGKYKLNESAKVLTFLDRIYAIDSGVNHLARTLGCKVTSWWGPTEPLRLLTPIDGLDEKIYYRKIFCSPCVHNIEIPPCLGNNLCLKLHVDPEIERKQLNGWLVERN